MKKILSILFPRLTAAVEFERGIASVQKTAARRLRKCSYCKAPSFRIKDDPNCPYCQYVEDEGFREQTA